MNIGTKSLLFGAHQFILHPLFVALAWRKLYRRFPMDPRIWLAFVIHDWGYWGCSNMDGREGELHPWWAARWFTRWLDCGGFLASLIRRLTPLPIWIKQVSPLSFIIDNNLSGIYEGGQGAAIDRLESAGHRIPEDQAAPMLGPWGRFCLFHSRSLARRYGEDVSPLCAPDKIASFMMPRWLYLTGTRWSGELAEYMAEGDTPAGREVGVDVSSPEAWFDSVKAYLDTLAVKIVAGGDPGIPPTRVE